MDPFDVAQTFIDRIQDELRLAPLQSAFQRALNILGFRYFACGSHVDPLNPQHAVMLITYPAEWVRFFSEMHIKDIDPVFQYATRSYLPFFWDAADFRARLTGAQSAVLAAASRYGVASGYTIPIHSPRAPYALSASCSVVPDSGAVDARAYMAVQLMACYAFESASRIVSQKAGDDSLARLSARQRECLELVAQGKDDWTIGKLLNLSEHTVHNHIECAKRRLGVFSRAHAVARAIETHQISYGDVVPHDKTPTRRRRRRRHAGRLAEPSPTLT